MKKNSQNSTPSKEEKSRKKRRQFTWEQLDRKMTTGAALKKFYDELMELKGREYTSEFLRGLTYFKPQKSRDEYIGDVPTVDLRDMPKETLLALRDAGSQAERNKIIKKWNRERNKTAD